MKYCSNCAASVVYKQIEGDHLPRYVCESCDTIHYQNPRVIVGCIPVYRGKVLLCRRGIEPRLGFWNIPGGFMENGETIEEGAFREAYEEARLDLENKGLVSIFTVPHINQVHIHFLGEVLSETWQLTAETTEIAFFDEENFPWEDIAFPSNIFSLKAYFEQKNITKREVKIGFYKVN